MGDAIIADYTVQQLKEAKIIKCLYVTSLRIHMFWRHFCILCTS